MLTQIFITIVLAQTCFGASWEYGDGPKGPANWGNDFPICNENSQSPIDIKTNDATYDDNLPIVDRSYFYTPPGGLSVINNGHTVQVNLLDNNFEINDDKLLPFKAKAAQYHFHWGTASGNSANTGGSEHTMDGNRPFGELHVVHYNTKYASLTEAVDKSDGLAVFGWFIKIGYPQTNLDIDNLLNLAAANAETKMDNAENISPKFSVETLLPPDLSVYYRYKGSLTTPGCFESVVWTVFKSPIEITQDQAVRLASTFHTTNVTTSDVIVDNYRPVQPLNGRSVTKPRPLVQSSGSISSPHIVTGVFVMMATALSLQ